jgi:hypothetical protein
MLEALCRQSSTTLDIVHAEDGPSITQRTSGLGDSHNFFGEWRACSRKATDPRSVFAAARFIALEFRCGHSVSFSFTSSLILPN